MKKKNKLQQNLSTLALTVFITGMLILPSVHRLHLTGHFDTHPKDCCQKHPHPHTHVKDFVADADPADPERQPHEHHASNCSICRLAKLLTLQPPVPLCWAHASPVKCATQLAVQPPAYKRNWQLPYACGPPAC